RFTGLASLRPDRLAASFQLLAARLCSCLPPLAKRNLYSATFRRTASIVRNGSDVANAAYLKTSSAQRTNGGLAPRARTRDPHLERTHPMLARQVGGIHGS